MQEMSANGKCVVCGKIFAPRKKTIGIDGKTALFLRVHSWCYRAMEIGNAIPIAFWKSVGCAK